MKDFLHKEAQVSLNLNEPFHKQTKENLAPAYIKVSKFSDIVFVL